VAEELHLNVTRCIAESIGDPCSNVDGDRYKDEISIALKVARRAASVLRPAFRAGYPEELDEAVEHGIRWCLLEAFPEYGYRGEETEPTVPPRDAQGQLCLVDPHDGTHALGESRECSVVNKVPFEVAIKSRCHQYAPIQTGDRVLLRLAEIGSATRRRPPLQRLRYTNNQLIQNIGQANGSAQLTSFATIKLDAGHGHE
jgi:hypothetical protein